MVDLGFNIKATALIASLSAIAIVTGFEYFDVQLPAVAYVALCVVATLMLFMLLFYLLSLLFRWPKVGSYKERDDSPLWMAGLTAPQLDKEKEIFQNAIDFSELRVEDCMVQRVDIEAVDLDECSVERLRDIFAQTQYSRIMIYQDTIDNIVGYANVKSLFNNPSKISDILHEVMIVPQTMLCEKLLASFIKEKKSIAVVVDEFGGTAGMITMEDILEEIFGDIEDEYDTVSTIERKLASGDYLFSGRLEVEYINERYGLVIEQSDEYDTLSGYIIYNLEDIPRQGDEIVIGDYKFRMIKMVGGRIDLIKVIVNYQ